MRLGDATFDAATGELRRGATVIRLEPQPAAVLALLAERAGRLVSHEEMRRAIWGDTTHVNFQQSLHYCVRQVRIALGEDGQSPSIETIPRRGYRLSVPLKPARPRAAKWVAWTSVALALLATTAFVERRPNRHHEAAVALLRTVHDLVY